jgi:hypothetical protein
MLDEHYPEKCPNLSMTEKEIWYYAGARELVRNLKIRLEQQLSEGEEVLR